MALIELTADDLCAMVSSPFPCEEGTIIDPIAVAHFLGFVETGADVFADADSGVARKGRKADERLALLSLACSMEATQAVTRGRSASPDAAEGEPERAHVKDALDAFTDGVIASPPVLTTVIPPPGTVIVIGTVVITIPTPPPVPPRWEAGEQLARTDLLALAVRFQSASKMSGIGTTSEDLAAAAARLIDVAMAR
ncbi:hypothetical protein EV649_4934 [Kribbella sp. VKM Ac-2569]|uniref:hypothetical protein n=1 Tax=Kribbella sp. VKM Ac-2569 TaxID=2512220 RepID=UPI00102CBE33|nr:hypothetical protein [Kribbella sp. VKM Ac-2569]RZT17395.1 hypothetical protein EV649_4934 [Kribbella sp. VKM Ac-2569]